ncbi:MAG: hydroxymethylbilane synthase [Vicinamibacterales bacterium]
MSTPSLPLRLGTRGSQLALYQANTVARLIEAAGAPRPEIVIIKTSGDRLQELPLSEVGGKRLFVKELEDALLNREIDLAVHSSKDMPAILPPELMIAGVLPRADPRDAVVLPYRGGADHQVGSMSELVARIGPAASIGTSSVRRVAQLTRAWPHARFSAIRGNLDTRLRKLDRGEYDVLVLAAAGLIRLGFEQRISLTLPLDVSVPAPGQGVIAIEIRRGDAVTQQPVALITDGNTASVLAAERALVETLGGGCQTPIGALATVEGADQLHLVGLVVSLDGRAEARAEGRGPITEAEVLGTRVAHALLAQGAASILEGARHAQS